MRDVGLDEVLAGLPAGLPLPVGCWLVARVAISLGASPRLLSPEGIRIDEQGAVTLGPPPQKVPYHLRSPESIHGGDCDEAAAVFNLGGLLVHTLTGRAPFLRGSDMESRLAVTEEAVPKLVGRVAQASSALDTIAARALRKDPTMRFSTPIELGEALYGYLEAELHEADANDLAAVACAALSRRPDDPASDSQAIGAIATRKKAVRRDNPLRGLTEEVDSAAPKDKRAGSERPPPKHASPRQPPGKQPGKPQNKPSSKVRGALRADRRIGGLRKPVSAPPERMAPLAEEEAEGLPMPRSLPPPPLSESSGESNEGSMDNAERPHEPFGAMPPSLETPLGDLAAELELPMADEDDLELDSLPVEAPSTTPRPLSSRPAGSLLELDERALREESSYAPAARKPVARPPRPAADDEDDDEYEGVGTAWLKPVGLTLFSLLALAIVYQFLIRPWLASMADGS